MIGQAGLLQYAYIGGSYELSGLGPYAWPVEFMGGRGVYGDQWSGNATNRYSATPVHVHAGSVSTLNATLVFAPAGLSGKIRLASGTPTGAFWVTAENALTGDSTGISQVNGDDFSVRGLNTGPILLRYGMVGGPTSTCLIIIPRQGLWATNITLTLPTASSCARPTVTRRTLPWSGHPVPRRSPAPAAIIARKGH